MNYFKTKEKVNNFKTQDIVQKEEEFEKEIYVIEHPVLNKQYGETMHSKLINSENCEAYIHPSVLVFGKQQPSTKRYQIPDEILAATPKAFIDRSRNGTPYYPNGLLMFKVITIHLKSTLKKYPYCIKYIVQSLIDGYIYDENLYIYDGPVVSYVDGFRNKQNVRTGFNFRRNKILSEIEIGRFEDNKLVEGCKTTMGTSPFPQYGVEPKKMSIQGTWTDGILNGEAAETYDIDGPNEHRLICSYVNGVRKGEALLEDVIGTPPNLFVYDSEGKEIPQGIQSPEVGGRVKQTKRKRRKIKKRRLRLSKRRF